MVDIDSTVRTINGIYMYRKDHTVESTIFTPWSKKVIPFPSLRCTRYRHSRMTEDRNMMIPWNDGNTVQFSTPPKMLRNLRR